MKRVQLILAGILIIITIHGLISVLFVHDSQHKFVKLMLNELTTEKHIEIRASTNGTIWICYDKHIKSEELASIKRRVKKIEDAWFGIYTPIIVFTPSTLELDNNTNK